MPFFKRDNSIRYHIFTYFTISALVAILLMGVSLYMQMSTGLSAAIEEENQSIVSQLNRSVESYLRTIMKLSDSLYYGVIKNADLSNSSVNSEFTLLYDNNKDNVENIALISQAGELLEAVPAARLKQNMDVTKEGWFVSTLSKMENMHFGNPKVQQIFDSSESQYRWVLPLSRAVEITQGSSTTQGILLIDMRYDSLEQLFDNVSLGNNGYVYLISSDGEIIYHPKIQLVDSGIYEENTAVAAGYRDGSYNEVFQGKNRMVTVKSVGYTGWKIVGVTPDAGITLNSFKAKLFVVFLIAFFLFILTVINAYISSKITNPIKELENSVRELEAGVLDAPVYTGGSYEIKHLGTSIQNMADQIRVLMDDIVVEHESKRKSEFDTLQSQINPHFLYNTLDIIVWMIENERQSEAVKAVTALARFFRISLSKGKSIIRVNDELEHVRNYLMIQNMRYKNRFTYSVTAEESVLELSSLKLMLQPLVENSIYHGMEFMDGDGEIEIKSFCRDGFLFFHVRDNGLGMTKERVDNLLDPLAPVASQQDGSSKGSGIGVRNVNDRIKLYFGEEYGLTIESEPDEGTEIIIRLPAIPYKDGPPPSAGGWSEKQRGE